MHVLDLIAGWFMDAARWLIILVLSLVYPSVYSPWTGNVVEVVRPHEITVVREDGKTADNIRLYGIHCPLPPHPYAKEAQDYVAQRLINQKVVVQPLPGKVEGPWYHPKLQPRDAYKRIIALVSIDGQSINKELLKKGVAWRYEPLVPFERGFKRLADIAKERKIGLWSLPNPSPSWNFTHTPVGHVNPFQDKILAESTKDSPAPKESKPPAVSSEKVPAPKEEPQKAVTKEEVSPRGPESLAADSAGPPQSTEPPSMEKNDAMKDECGEERYLVRLKRAYRAINTLVSSYTYICRQIALHWEERGQLAASYALNPEQVAQAEKLVKAADHPCPGSIRNHERVQELWSLCMQLRVLAHAETDDQGTYEGQLQDVTRQTQALTTALDAVLPSQ